MHLATNVVIDSGVFERPRGASDLSNTVEAGRVFAARLAQPYGAISTHAWRILSQIPDQQNAYLCQLRVFHYWQKPSRQTYEEAMECVAKNLAENPDSAPMRANLAFLQVEAVRARYRIADGDILARKQMLDEALANASRAVQIAPASARAHSAMGAAYMINRAFPSAVAAAREENALFAFAVEHAAANETGQPEVGERERDIQNRRE